MRRFIGAALALAIGAGVAGAAPLNAYSGYVAFGDSLTDSGNLPSGVRPPAPYADGRYSNGPVWAEGLAAKFSAARNYAHGGAKAVTDATPDGRDDFAAQIDRFGAESPALGARPLASVWFGANDLRAAILSGGDPGLAIRNALGALGAGLGRLYGMGVRDVLVVNLPALGLTPAFSAQKDAANALTNAFNTGLSQSLALLKARAPGLTLTLLDSNRLLREVFATPARYGLRADKLGQTCLSNPADLPGCAGYLFFDGIHPTAQMHAIIADRAQAALVPLPAPGLLLICSLGALAAHRRRAAAI